MHQINQKTILFFYLWLCCSDFRVVFRFNNVWYTLFGPVNLSFVSDSYFLLFPCLFLDKKLNLILVKDNWNSNFHYFIWFYLLTFFESSPKVSVIVIKGDKFFGKESYVEKSKDVDKNISGLLTTRRFIVTSPDSIAAVGLAENNFHSKQVANCLELLLHLRQVLFKLSSEEISTSKSELVYFSNLETIFFSTFAPVRTFNLIISRHVGNMRQLQLKCPTKKQHCEALYL